MKLKEGFVLHSSGSEYMMAASGEAAKNFNGLVRGNETAYFILKNLVRETTEEAIVEAMVRKYDAPREKVAADVHNFIEKLRADRCARAFAHSRRQRNTTVPDRLAAKSEAVIACRQARGRYRHIRTE